MFWITLTLITGGAAFALLAAIDAAARRALHGR